jgi:Tol biopolymer transport system component
VVNADGSNLVRHTDGGSNNSPTWSPDGLKLAFASLPEDRSHWGVHVMTLLPNGVDVVQIGPLFLYSPAPSWSPDGSRIAFLDESRRRVYVMGPDGSNVAQLPSVEGPYEGLGRPAWSPDGSAVVVPAWAEDYWGYGGTLSYLLLVRIDGSEARILMDGYGDTGVGAWSPDGTMIAFQSVCDSANPCIGYVSLDGRVSSVTVRDAFGAAWRP